MTSDGQWFFEAAQSYGCDVYKNSWFIPQTIWIRDDLFNPEGVQYLNLMSQSTHPSRTNNRGHLWRQGLHGGMLCTMKKHGNFVGTGSSGTSMGQPAGCFVVLPCVVLHGFISFSSRCVDAMLFCAGLASSFRLGVFNKTYGILAITML